MSKLFPCKSVVDMRLRPSLSMTVTWVTVLVVRSLTVVVAPIMKMLGVVLPVLAVPIQKFLLPGV